MNFHMIRGSLVAKLETKIEKIFENKTIVFTITISKMYRVRMFFAVMFVKLAGFCLGAKETEVNFLKDEVRHE